MPHHNCHLIEARLSRAEKRLNQIRTNITIYEQYLKTYPGHQPTISLLAELHTLEHQQENEVSNLQSELEDCKAQNGMKDQKHEKDH